jgi:hypothetical protein
MGGSLLSVARNEGGGGGGRQRDGQPQPWRRNPILKHSGGCLQFGVSGVVASSFGGLQFWRVGSWSVSQSVRAGLVMVTAASRQRAGGAFSLACCWGPLPFCGGGPDAARLGFGLLDMDAIPASERCELQRVAKPPTVDRFEWPQRRQRISSLGRATLPACLLLPSLLPRERASHEGEGASQGGRRSRQL